MVFVAILAAPASVGAQPDRTGEGPRYLLGAVLEGTSEARVGARDELRPPDSNFPPPLRLGNDIVPVATVSSLPLAWSWVVRALGATPSSTMVRDGPVQPSTETASARERSLRSGATVRAVSVHTLSTGPQELSATPLSLSRILSAPDTAASLARPLASRLFVSPFPQPFLGAPTTATIEIRAGAQMVVLEQIDQCVSGSAFSPATIPDASVPASCLRWVRVIAEDGGLLTAGVVPAFQVVTARGWSCDRYDSCVHLSYVGRDGGDALFQVLLARPSEEVQWASVRVPTPANVVPAVEAVTSRGRVSLTRNDGAKIAVPLPTFTKVPAPIASNIRAMQRLDVVLDPKHK